MKLFNVLYRGFHRMCSRPSERGEYSSGLWPDEVRSIALEWCRDVQGKALEIGCGEGLFVSQLIQQNLELDVWGVDNDSCRLEQAGEKAAAMGQRICLAKEDACNISFASGYFDAVICINVLFNLDSFLTVTKVLAEMQRVCKPGGRIIFDFRNSRNPALKVKYGLARYYDATVQKIHLKTYSPGQINHALKQLGLTVTRSRFLGFFIPGYAPVIVIEAKK
jgi:ubiquinone/menaquinone biosynthesis C-methylase UbiE